MKDIFLIDFDRTISFNDSTNVLMQKCNPMTLKIVKDKYRANQIGIMEFMKTCIESLTVNKEEYIEALSGVKIDKTFKKVLEEGLDYRIVSAGTKLNVISSLEKNGIHVDDNLVISNEIIFGNEGIKLEFPYADEKRYFGMDKRSLVLDYKAKGFRIFFVGDGPSDYEAVQVADYVFARSSSRLVIYCQENNIKFSEFSDFEDLLRKYKEEICGTE